MEQRPLRLGDIVDDYCPRERRITNHVIVAIVEDAIRQTRCSTCDAEHVFKDARMPRRRSKSDDAGAAVGQLVSRAADATSPPAAMSAAAEPVKPAPAPAPAAPPPVPAAAAAATPSETPDAEIGRASCRERVSDTV